MKNFAFLILVLFFFGGFGSCKKRKAPILPTAIDTKSTGNLENGFYLILRKSAKKADVEPIKRDERLVVYDYKYLEGGSDRPTEYLALPPQPGVPLILAGDPQKGKTSSGKGLLNLQLAPEHAKTLENFTRKNLGGAVALVIGGEVITTHKIRAVIKGGALQITRCTDNGCEVLFLKLKK